MKSRLFCRECGDGLCGECSGCFYCQTCYCEEGTTD